MGSASCNGEEVIKSFVGRTRESFECAICVEFFNDPVEVKCGHLFCRTCVNRLLVNQPNSDNSKVCPLCQVPIMKNDLKDISPRMSMLTKTLQQFLHNFCKEGGVKVTGTSGPPTNSSQESSKTMPLPVKEKEKRLLGQDNSSTTSHYSSETMPLPREEIEKNLRHLDLKDQDNSSNPSQHDLKTKPLKGKERIQSMQEKTIRAETSVNSSDTCGRVSSAPPKLAEEIILEPQNKVHQWLMTNVDSSTNNEDYENAPTVKDSGSVSTDSSKLLLSSPFTLSSTGKDSYDIVSAPSPPPRPDEFPQTKRGRGGRRSSRPRKNALPISSGEPSAKKRGRPSSRTPETKKSVTTTPGPSASSPELSASILNKTCTMTSTPRPDTPGKGAASAVRSKDSSFYNENSVMEDDTITGNLSRLSSKEVLEKSIDSSIRKSIASENTPLSARTPVGVPNKPDDKRLTESCMENRPALQPLSYIPASSPQLEMLTSPPSTAQHLTPVARPKIRSSLTNVTNSLHRAVNDSRRHSSAEGLLRGVGQRTVSFIHKGRIVPKTPITWLPKQPIVFTCLGKLAVRSKISADSNAVLNVTVSDSSPTRKPGNFIETTENETTTKDLVLVASVATQTEEVEAINFTVASQPSAQLLMESQMSVLKEPVEQKSPLVSPTKSNGKTDRLIELDEHSEDAFMFAEPFKRTRVLSSSDSEGEKSEVKRRRSSPSAQSAIKDPLSLVEPKPDLPEKLSEQVSPSDAVFKTVVLESDPESDEADIVPATPPCPPRPKQAPVQRKIFTCSGLPRSQVKLVEDWARGIGAEISLIYTPAVTHVIVHLDEENCAQRTLKFLFGVASGKWIVGIDWVHKSIREGKLVDEEPFEALDMDGENGPQRARQRCRTNKLFQAFEFCCQEPFSDVTVDQLRELLELCGATTVSSPSELTKKRRHSMIIVQTDEQVGLEVQRKASSWFERLQILSVSREWVLDCLASYQLLPIRSQLIGKHPESLLKLMGFDAQLMA